MPPPPPPLPRRRMGVPVPALALAACVVTAAGVLAGATLKQGTQASEVRNPLIKYIYIYTTYRILSLYILYISHFLFCFSVAGAREPRKGDARPACGTAEDVPRCPGRAAARA